VLLLSEICDNSRRIQSVTIISSMRSMQHRKDCMEIEMLYQAE
jgi:hypothetical protein